MFDREDDAANFMLKKMGIFQKRHPLRFNDE